MHWTRVRSGSGITLLPELYSCKGTLRWGGAHTTEYKAWKEQHTECNANYTGTSGGMEADAAETLWIRSVDRHKFRYTTLLSDCDSKTYKYLCALNVYGDDTVIVKEECINRVTQRWEQLFESCPLKARRRESLLAVGDGES